MLDVRTETLRQTIYKAHGSSASWEWLAMVSPCIDTIRTVASEINGTLGSHQGAKHASPDLWRDITELMKKLDEFGVYKERPGRTISGKKAMVPNVLDLGLLKLQAPLKNYNDTFRRQQERRRVTPLLAEPSETPPNPSATPPPTSPEPPRVASPVRIPPSPEQSVHEDSSEASDSESSKNASDGESDAESGTGSSDEDEAEAQGMFGEDWDELLARETEEDVALDME